MIELVKKALVGQFEAGLCMMNQCITACPEEHWEKKIGVAPFRWVTYHTLFFGDFYLSPGEKAFALRDLHYRGGDEREPMMCAGLSREETLEYVAICRRKAVQTIADETEQSLQGPSGFDWLKFPRLEAHVYTIRH